jgi:photosystem II stability/assembly factor-like uncharacterized protein
MDREADPVNPFERVVQILDQSIGGPTAVIRAHGPFWRGLTRDQFVAEVVFEKPLVVVGRGSESNLVLALRGAAPFDLTEFRRMPAGRPPVPAPDIDFIERWIDEGCPEEEIPDEPVRAWRATNAPMADQDRGKRYDDVWFVTPDLGWGVNSDGKILRTSDGGASWELQFHNPATYLRCLGFASPTRGWAGTLSGPARLLETDDGQTWSAVTGLPAGAPQMVCGLSVVDESVVYASGTNYPFGFADNAPPAMLKTLDGGASWSAIDMRAHAALLVDTWFPTPDRGWVVGGRADPGFPPGPDGRDNVKPVVLLTEDGGLTWVDRVADLHDELPLGEWGWKIQFLDERLGFVSLENFRDGAVLKTTDGGEHWERVPVDDPQQNTNLEGVGFLDAKRGWVGGWGTDFSGGQSSATDDGGETWRDANEIGRFVNRFRFVGSPVTVGYAAGATVYKYSDEPVPAPMRTAFAAPETAAAGLLAGEVRADDGGPVRVPFTVPEGAARIEVNVWERFGRHVARLLDERDPAPGARTVDWDAGRPGSYIVRVTVDDDSESQIVAVGAP